MAHFCPVVGTVPAISGFALSRSKSSKEVHQANAILQYILHLAIAIRELSAT